MPTIDETITFIKQSNAGQRDKSGRDYYHHPIIASGNRDAIQVKLADMSENSDPARLTLLEPARREHFVQKYTAPLEAFRAALG